MNEISQVDLAFNRLSFPKASGSFKLCELTQLLSTLSQIYGSPGSHVINPLVHFYASKLHRIFEQKRQLLKSEYWSSWKEKNSAVDLLSNVRLAYIWFKLGEHKNDFIFINSALKMMDILRNVILSTCTLVCGIPDQFPLRFQLSPVHYSTKASIAFIEACLCEYEVREQLQLK